LSERIDWALRRAMTVDKEQRPATCREFVEDLTGHSTRKITASTDVQQQDVWYLIYTDEENVARTVKGTLHGIRRSLKEGVLGDASNIRASRTKTGPFEALRNHPEFRDLVMPLQSTPTSGNAVLGPKAGPQGASGAPRSQPAAIGAAQPTPVLVRATPALPLAEPVVDIIAPPLINLGPTETGYEWVKWAVLGTSIAAIAAALAALSFFFVPHLVR
jgi:hypothetical protein